MKPYLKRNKLAYGLYFLLYLVAMFCLKIYDVYITSISDMSAMSNQDGVWMILIGLMMGIISIITMVMQLYLMIRPFKQKQLKEVVLLGQNPMTLIHTHCICVVLFILATMAVDQVFGRFIYSASLVDATLQSTWTLSTVFTQFGQAAWVCSVPLFLYSGSILANYTTKKRAILIIGGVITLWLVLYGGLFFYNMMDLFNQVEIVQSFVDAQTTGTQATVSSFNLNEHIWKSSWIINVSGIVVFIIGYYNFRKHYEIKI